MNQDQDKPFLVPWRYQLNKIAATAIRRGHPWIYRKALSSAAQVLPIPGLVKLVDGDNAFLGYAIHEPLGSVAMRRLIGVGETFSLDTFLSSLIRLHRRKSDGDAYRLINGEADGFPGLTADVYADCLVWQYYLCFWESLLPVFDRELQPLIGHRHYVFTRGGKQGKRLVQTNLDEEPVLFREGDFHLHAYPLSGQKTGFYLDLRPVRKLIPEIVPGHRVLNCFASGGVLSMIAEKSGAAIVRSIETNWRGLEWVGRLYEANGLCFDLDNWQTGDVFTILSSSNESYDLVILDPPQLCSRKEAVANGLKAWKELLRKAGNLQGSRGMILIVNCSSFLNPFLGRDFFRSVFPQAKCIVSGGLPPDHTISLDFSEGDYLHWWLIETGNR